MQLPQYKVRSESRLKDRILSKKNLSGYDKRIYTAEKISILSQKGDTEGVNKIIDENLEDPELRKIKIQACIEERDLKTAKKLLEEGIKTLTQKGRNQNMIKEWTAVLIYIAELEKDIPTIRHYAKKIALEDKGNIEYYEKWKKTYTFLRKINELNRLIFLLFLPCNISLGRVGNTK